MKTRWIVINCNSLKEADRIGKSVLRQRLCACYDILPRLKTAYFWPPKSSKIETGKGAQLVVVTISKLDSKVRSVVARLHSDTLPSINGLTVEVSAEYARWVNGEVKL